MATSTEYFVSVSTRYRSCKLFLSMAKALGDASKQDKTIYLLIIFIGCKTKPGCNKKDSVAFCHGADTVYKRLFQSLSEVERYSTLQTVCFFQLNHNGEDCTVHFPPLPCSIKYTPDFCNAFKMGYCTEFNQHYELSNILRWHTLVGSGLHQISCVLPHHFVGAS